MTKKELIDDVLMIASDFVPTDDSRLSERWISYKIDHIRAEKIIRNYNVNENVDFAWLSPPFYISLYKINEADNAATFYSNCEMSKCEIPPVISLTNPQDSNQDVGIYALMSSDGKFAYYPRALQMIQMIPAEHAMKKFRYYARYNTTLYVTGIVDRLRLSPILLYPEDGYLTNSAPVASGSLVSGTTYIVKFGNVVYNSVQYLGNDPTRNTFTATATATYTGSGKVYLYNQVEAFEETDPYPVGGEMAREIVLEILTKEFAIEQSMLGDYENDNTDDFRKKKAGGQAQ